MDNNSNNNNKNMHTHTHTHISHAHAHFTRAHTLHTHRHAHQHKHLHTHTPYNVHRHKLKKKQLNNTIMNLSMQYTAAVYFPSITMAGFVIIKQMKACDSSSTPFTLTTHCNRSLTYPYVWLSVYVVTIDSQRLRGLLLDESSKCPLVDINNSHLTVLIWPIFLIDLTTLNATLT